MTAAEADSNLQSRKIAFAETAGAGPVYNPDRVQDPLSPYQLMASSLIPASLITGINSDLPGPVIAQVTQNVFDTPTSPPTRSSAGTGTGSWGEAMSINMMTSWP